MNHDAPPRIPDQAARDRRQDTDAVAQRPAPDLGCGIIVVDFEALTPKGRPMEPIEVAALALRHVGGRWREQARFSALIRPPDDIPVTARCTALTGITAAMLKPARSAREVLGELDRRLAAPPYRLVAHSAGTEGSLIRRQAEHCPNLAATPLIDTVAMARTVLPELGTHRLDAVLAHPAPHATGKHRGRIGLVAEALARSSAEVADAVTDAASALRRAGLDVVEVDAAGILATVDELEPQLGAFELAPTLDGYLSRYEIEYSVEELIPCVDDELAREMLHTSQQLRDQPNRPKLKEELDRQLAGLAAAYHQLFARQDLAAILMPTVPVSPPRVDDVLRDARSLDRQRDRFMLLTTTTKLATMVGAPSLSIPVAAPTGCGLLLDGLPQGDDALLNLAEHLAGALG